MSAPHLHFLNHPRFFDLPEPRRRTRRYSLPSSLDWGGWVRTEHGPWTGWHPSDNKPLPEQGWKVHATATDSSATILLHRISEYCHSRRLVFKHLTSVHDLHSRNAKEADRGGSGKFITIYPRDEQELRITLEELDTLVGGLPGPRVLSDLQWRNGPLSVRYGAFHRATLRTPSGAVVGAMRSTDGTLVEDRRTPVFAPPFWAELPSFLADALAALGDETAPDSFRYRVTRALHYSNAGGVYEAEQHDGTAVVLKEGRPLAGLTPDGRDAVTRLHDEERALRVLAGPGVVGVLDAFTLHDHAFLALERIEGTSLSGCMVARNPMIRVGATEIEYAEYRQWALALGERVSTVVARIHASGLVHGDLHPGNVLVTPGDDVVLIDFEMAHPIDEDRETSVGMPGFVATDGRTGIAADLYAVACIKLFLFLPLTPLIALDPAKADDLIDAAQITFALDDDWCRTVRAQFGLRPPQQAESAPAATASAAIHAWDATERSLNQAQICMGRGIAASASYGRSDRAWPGDPRQFDENGIGLDHGAAGVIHALDACQVDLDPTAIDWFEGATEHALGNDEAVLGLFDGLAGAGWVHRRNGRDDLADRTLARVLDAPLARFGDDLIGGLPGIGLYLLEEARRDPRLTAVAADLATPLRERLAARTTAHGDSRAVPTGTGGLMGASAIALFASRLYTRTGDPIHLRLAVDAVEQDLQHCVTAADGSLQINEGWRTLPYLKAGSAGVGLAISQLLPHLDDPTRYSGALAGIELAATSAFTIDVGLWTGRAGLIHFLVALSRAGLTTSPDTDRALTRHVEALSLHAARFGGGILFPGRRSLRLSADLATGTAGVLTAIAAYSALVHHEETPDWPALLPMLIPELPAHTAQATSLPRERR